MKVSQVTIVAAPTADPVAKAANKIGFSKFRETNKGFCLRWSSDGPGVNCHGFVTMLNMLLKKVMLPGDRPFNSPAYNGRSVCSSATIGSRNYIIEIDAGVIQVTKVPVHRKPGTKKK